MGYPYKPDKQIIYLDQSVISNMMMSINTKDKSYHKRDKLDLWQELFVKLETLKQLEKIVCPYSSYHEQESLISYDFEALQTMYKHLANGISFTPNELIEQHQIHENLQSWLNQAHYDPVIDKSYGVHGNPNRLTERIYVNVVRKHSEEEIEGIRKYKQWVYTTLCNDIFKRRSGEKNKSFNDWFMEEARAIWPSIYKIFIGNIVKWAQMEEGYKNGNVDPKDMLDMLDNPYDNHIHSIRESIKKSRETCDETTIEKSLIEYLNSPHFIQVPFIEIESLLYAGIAHKACHWGQKQPPNEGNTYDVNIISKYLPYCDVMLVDSYFWELLNNGSIKSKLKRYDTMIFPTNKKWIEEFMEYLDRIQEGITKTELSLIMESRDKEEISPYIKFYEQHR